DWLRNGIKCESDKADALGGATTFVSMAARRRNSVGVSVIQHRPASYYRQSLPS
ncbi:hypothetical protein AAVH_37250, partial [Aphelenchoides avenae]